ncbi:MAG TPA: META domain-containing protein [Myxococcota bacterium]|nr:META domain-containing protein [Myxococcota bacterium]
MSWRLALASVLMLGCSGGAKPAITDRDWALIALGEKSDPIGSGERPVTLRLESSTSRASGFAGCNHYSGPYELGSGKLSFGPTVSTKMFCESSQAVEDAYLAALGKVSSWELANGGLTLRGVDGSALRFRPAAPSP